MSRRSVVVTVTGELNESLRGEFEDADVVVANSVTKILLVDADTARLHGVLHRIEDLGLELLDVQPIEDTPPVV